MQGYQDEEVLKESSRPGTGFRRHTDERLLKEQE